MPKPRTSFTPDPAQMALWPAISGNEINGLGEMQPRRASPIYWHPPESTPHGRLQQWFYERSKGDPQLTQARAERQRVMETPLAPISQHAVTLSAQQWTHLIKEAATTAGADMVGIARMQADWTFEGFDVPQNWIVVIGVVHDYDQIKVAPAPAAAAEVVRQYARANVVARHVASIIRCRGHEAVPHGGPMAGPVVLIPAAIACGFGELGKHGSIINPTYGSNFRLACVLTDVPLQPGSPLAFGADNFCTRCRACVDSCPPLAIGEHKQVVRGSSKWYVDFDKCLPYFNESLGCGICIARCPRSRPGVTAKLVARFAIPQRRYVESARLPSPAEEEKVHISDT